MSSPELERKARLRLRAGTKRRDLVRYRRVLQALVLPSFQDCYAYEILVSAEKPSEPAGVRTLWRKIADLEKLRNPVVRLKYGVQVEPTIEESVVNLPEDDVKSLLTLADNLRVSPRILNPLRGIDGISYEVSFGDLSARSRFEWWAKPPAGWEPLHDLAQRIRELVDRCNQP